MDAATQAYRTARAINSQPETVMGDLRTLDALIITHPRGFGLLAAVRQAAAGS